MTYDPIIESEAPYFDAWDRAPRELGLSAEILRRPVADLRLRPAAAIGEDAPIAAAIDLMREHESSCVMVVSDGRLTGTLGERDLLRRCSFDSDFVRRPVREIMVSATDSLRPWDAIGYALHLVVVRGIRHVPVTDADGRPRHVFGMQDVARLLADHYPKEVVNQPPDPHRIAARRHGG